MTEVDLARWGSGANPKRPFGRCLRQGFVIWRELSLEQVWEGGQRREAPSPALLEETTGSQRPLTRRTWQMT